MRDARSVERGDELGVIAGAGTDGNHHGVTGDLALLIAGLHPHAALGEAGKGGGGEDLHAELGELSKDAGRTGGAQVGAGAFGHLQHGDLLAGDRQRIGDLQAHQTAADHDDALARDRLALEHVVRDVYVLAGKAHGDGGGTVGDDHAVEVLAGDGLGRERGVQTHLDAGALGLLAHELGGDLHLVLAGGLAGGHELPAQVVARLKHHGLVATCHEGLGGHEAGHAATHDGDALGLVGGLDLPVKLVAHERVAQAGDVLEVARVGKAVQAALVAAHAIHDAVRLALARLVAELGVGELGAAHDHEVNLVVLEDLLGELGRVDAADADGGHAGLAADARGVVYIEAGLEVDRRHLERVGGSDDVAARDVEHVDAGLAGHLAELDGVLDGHAVLEAVVERADAHEQGHVLGDVLADGADAGERELGAVLQGAAPLVVSVVQAGGEEGVRQVVVGAVELDAVVARLDAARGGLAVAVDDLVDLLDGDAGDLEAVDAHGLGHEDLRFGVHGDGDGALPQLDAGAPALAVDGVGEAAVPLDEAVFGDGEEAVGGAGRVDRGDFHDGEAHAAGGADAVVLNELVGDLALMAHARAHGGHHHAVAHGERLDGEGLEELGEHGTPI